MVDQHIIDKLMVAFPDSFINSRDEFIAHRRANEYFLLGNCETEIDVQCKVLEWLSRGAYKTEPFERERQNREFHAFMRSGINNFLCTRFTCDDMEQIYTYLGNAVNHSKTVRFIENGYDMTVLEVVKQ